MKSDDDSSHYTTVCCYDDDAFDVLKMKFISIIMIWMCVCGHQNQCYDDCSMWSYNKLNRNVYYFDGQSDLLTYNSWITIIIIYDDQNCIYFYFKQVIFCLL